MSGCMTRRRHRDVLNALRLRAPFEDYALGAIAQFDSIQVIAGHQVDKLLQQIDIHRSLRHLGSR